MYWRNRFVEILAAIILASVTTHHAVADVTCEDKEVVAEFVERLVCGGLIEKCAKFGVASYKELRTLSRDDLTKRVSDSYRPFLAALPGNATSRGFYQQLLQSQVATLMAAGSVISDVRIFPSDYKAAIRRYTCQADISYVDQELDQYAKSAAFLAIVQAQVQILQVFLVSDNGRGLQVMMASVGQVATVMRNCIQKRTAFTVQPSASFAGTSRFIIDWNGNLMDPQCVQTSGQ